MVVCGGLRGGEQVMWNFDVLPVCPVGLTVGTSSTEQSEGSRFVLGLM